MSWSKPAMPHAPDPPSANRMIRWVDDRLPILALLDKEFGRFPCPKNFNYLWNFGALASAMMVIMIATGVVLAMSYQPNAQMAFASVQHIMRDANYGWLVRSIHQIGSSMFFIVTYVHTFRGIYYGSYKRPRELLWILGVVTLLIMMGTAFMGYVLPWGQMSYWGATVITSMFSAVPLVGDSLVTWLWGGFGVDSPTLTRFYSLHYLLPFVLVGVVMLHVAAIHIVGSNNPLGIDVKAPQDTIPFHPYYTIKDCFGLCVFLAIYAGIVFFAPDLFSDPTNFVPADPLRTPADIQPEWYFLPFYAILRAVPDKLGGIILMIGSIALLLALPWLDTSPVRSGRFRPVFRPLFFLWLAAIVLLGVVGAHRPEGIWILLGRAGTAWYFAFLVIVLPLLGWLERPLPLPESISRPVLGGGALPATGSSSTAETR